MFKDYYSILAVTINATDQEIKQAFRTQAIKWHPDRNHGLDTTSSMQEINEANLILKDPEARARYNIAYNRYKTYQNNEQNTRAGTSEEGNSKQKKPSDTNKASKNESFKIQDDILEHWMQNAKKQAVDLAIQTIKDFKGVSKAASKGLLSGLIQLIIWIIAANLLLFIIRLIKN